MEDTEGHSSSVLDGPGGLEGLDAVSVQHHACSHPRLCCTCSLEASQASETEVSGLVCKRRREGESVLTSRLLLTESHFQLF